MAGRAAALAILALSFSTPAMAQTADERIEQLERIVGEQDARIRELEALIRDRLGGNDQDNPEAQGSANTAANVPTGTQTPDFDTIDPQEVADTQPPLGGEGSPLQISVDARLRYEYNGSDRDGRNRGRGVFRARLGATYDVLDFLTVGARLVTGDPDDPNSADLSLSNFDDDLAVALDQAYIRLNFGGLTIDGGKIPQVFQRTDLVWDGDVSPQGVSARYHLPISDMASIEARALYFLIDEASAGPDSDMIGGQLVLNLTPASDFAINLAGGYFDYSLRSLTGADIGDFRGNLLTPSGRYLSDFDLINILGSVTWTGLGDAWPLRLAGDFVHNSGAATDADSGYALYANLGRASAPGDWQFGYTYASVGTDAVMAAFSHDNLGISTNYRLHGLTVDFVPIEHITLNATFYHYRPRNVIDAAANDPTDWLNRLRFNFLVHY
jgi:putative porin